MSTQPPSGPPPGPLGAPAAGPPPAPRPRRRGRPVLVGAAVAAAVAAVAVAAVLVLGRDGGAHRPRAGASAQARELADRVALAPGDWGPTFRRADPYESDEVPRSVADEDCALVRKPAAHVLAARQRAVRTADRTAVASSAVVVHDDEGVAAAAVARSRADTRRCATEYDARHRKRWEDVHAVDVPDLEGLDEQTAEQGRMILDANGREADSHYTLITGRKGNVLLQTSVGRSGSQGRNREEALDALALMLSRL
ncbi:hypothetical protein [Streptomyces sp. NPDC006193]|uniref:hypothetical protein n=1 Tax=Streptomyces sp. NPDC006193 TaxID=3155717 RepID=UPI0033A6EA52